MHSLPLYHRISGQPVIVLGEGEMAAAKRRLVERAGGIIVGADHATARLALLALDDPEPVATVLRARGILINVADRPELCDFTLPSILERDPVLISIGTGGASAGLAKALRLRLESLLPASLGALASGLFAARARLRERMPIAEDRRRALDAALSAGGALDPLVDLSARNLPAWLDGATTGNAEVVTITLSGADPDDLTLRQLRWLGSADLIVHDMLTAPTILARARADAPRRVLDAAEPVNYGNGLTVIIRMG